MVDVAKIFENYPSLYDGIVALRNAGVTLKTTFYSIIAEYDGLSIVVSMPVSIPTIAKSLESLDSKLLILSRMESLIKDAEKKFGLAIIAAKQQKEPKEEQPKQAQVNLDTPVKLANATAIGQASLGTNSGSIYRVVALSPTVKVACRVSGDRLSVRVEGNPTKDEVKKIEGNSPLTEKGGYWSAHIEIGDVPIKRIIGALIMDMGIDFSVTAKSSELDKFIK